MDPDLHSLWRIQIPPHLDTVLTYCIFEEKYRKKKSAEFWDSNNFSWENFQKINIVDNGGVFPVENTVWNILSGVKKVRCNAFP